MSTSRRLAATAAALVVAGALSGCGDSSSPASSGGALACGLVPTAVAHDVLGTGDLRPRAGTDTTGPYPAKTCSLVGTKGNLRVAVSDLPSSKVASFREHTRSQAGGICRLTDAKQETGVACAPGDGSNVQYYSVWPDHVIIVQLGRPQRVDDADSDAAHDVAREVQAHLG